MLVKFYYQDKSKNTYRLVRETMIKSLSHALSTLIPLPETVEVCIYDLPDNVYGGLDKHTPNRLGLNSKLPLERIPEILVHELIHASQRHTNMLDIKNNGTYYWRGIPYHNTLPENLDYHEYKNSPWELDVDERLDKLLTETLSLAKQQQISNLTKTIAPD